jgi:two-component system, LuxR family, sensor histidine kinase DctS
MMSRRWLLWGMLAILLLSMLGVLIWLAGRYETSQWLDRLERDAHEANRQIKSGLLRNVQSIQALTQADTNIETFAAGAVRLMHDRRELLRIEQRDVRGRLLSGAISPYVPSVQLPLTPEALHADVAQACTNARRLGIPAYAPSLFVPQGLGRGLEVLPLCLPQVRKGQTAGYLLAYYSLPGVLQEWVGAAITRDREASFTEGDGTRLATYGRVVHSAQATHVQQIVDLPGNPLVLRLGGWRTTPSLFPNVLTALVASLSLGLVGVMLLLGRDMRKRQKAEADLAQALAFRKAMEDSLITGLRARDLQGRITYVNPAFCQMVGLSASQLLGQSIPAPYWPPEQVEEYTRRQAIRLAGNQPPREGYESVFIRQGGERFPVLVIEAPLIDGHGHQTGWMSAILDVSEQRRVEELSRTSQERLQATARLATAGEMASLLSHELNQPLAAISSYATGSLNLLDQPNVPVPDLQEAVKRIAEQADRAGKVIKSVHDFVRRRHDERQRVSAQALIDAVLPLIQLQARKTGVRLHIDVAPDLPPLFCDRTMVEQVLLNLARNGMQAMGQVPVAQRHLSITVRVQPAPPPSQTPWVAVAVADSGAGITPDVAQQLFTPFFTTKAEGMGLGLSLCRTVIEQHGGSLDYRDAPGGGTVFTFTLPCAILESPAT